MAWWWDIRRLQRRRLDTERCSGADEELLWLWQELLCCFGRRADRRAGGGSGRGGRGGPAVPQPDSLVDEPMEVGGERPLCAARHER